MHILMYRWKAYNYRDIEQTFLLLGHTVDNIEQELGSYDVSPEFERVIEEKIRGTHYDMVFTVNYFPLISNVCERTGVKYVSWTCDNPLISMYHESVFHDCNYIFTFDKTNYLEFRGMGVKHIWYLPLAVDTERMDALLGVPEKAERRNATQDSEMRKYRGDVAFVGSLYEKNSYDRIEDRLTPYLKGYFDAAMNAQTDIFGDNIFDRLLTPDILAQLSQLIDFKNSERSLSDMGLVFNTTFLGFKMAQRERIGCLSLLGMNHEVKLYTDSHLPIEGVHNMGSVEYHNDMPRVFCGSDINMNFTIRNIRSGIPLRVWDIMACGGFVLTNFQAELPAYFEDGVHMAWFGSIDDMRRKADYYLAHDDERRQIAEQGRRFVMQNHTYRNRIEVIFNILEKEGAIYEQ